MSLKSDLQSRDPFTTARGLRALLDVVERLERRVGALEGELRVLRGAAPEADPAAAAKPLHPLAELYRQFRGK